MKKIIIASLCMILTTVASYSQDNRRIEIKSGIITMSSEILGREVITKKYFDDYGDKLATFTTASYFEDGERKEKLLYGQVTSGDSILLVDYLGKTLRFAGRKSESINFLNLTEEMIKKHKIKRHGEGEVCGKPCVKYSSITESNGKRAKSQSWVWKGISLKMIIKALPLEYEIEAIDIQVDVPIDPSVFVVPDYPLVSSPSEAN